MTLLKLTALVAMLSSGRVLGYDNSHGYSHKHLMGKEAREPNIATLTDIEALRERFTAEWKTLDAEFNRKEEDKMTKESVDKQLFERLGADEYAKIEAEDLRRKEIIRAMFKGEPINSPDVHALTIEEWRAGKRQRSLDNWCSMHLDN